MEFEVKHALAWMEAMDEKIQSNKEYLTELDQAIGDGDHGINMSRGFREVIDKISNSDYTAVSDLFKDVAMTLMSKVGGASGPLFGTAFLKLSTAVKGKEYVDYESFVAGLEEALAGVKQRGKSDEGEKTLVDVWAPVVETMKRKEEFDADTISSAAEQAKENTKETNATKGRAAYLGDRSIGHIDPGSVSSWYLFEALAEVVREGAQT